MHSRSAESGGMGISPTHIWRILLTEECDALVVYRRPLGRQGSKSPHLSENAVSGNFLRGDFGYCIWWIRFSSVSFKLTRFGSMVAIFAKSARVS